MAVLTAAAAMPPIIPATIGAANPAVKIPTVIPTIMAGRARTMPLKTRLKKRPMLLKKP
jgi:hypothetical protein